MGEDQGAGAWWSLRCIYPLHNDLRILDEVRHGALPSVDEEPGDPGWDCRWVVLRPPAAEAAPPTVDRKVFLAVFGLGHLAIRYNDVSAQRCARGPKAASPARAAVEAGYLAHSELDFKEGRGSRS